MIEPPTVVNIKDVSGAFWNDPDFQYIGRPIKSNIHNGYLGNPFVIGRGMTRESAIIKFECYARDRIKTDPIYRQRVKDLAGKTLVCYCKPKPCHGDVLARLCQELNNDDEATQPGASNPKTENAGPQKNPPKNSREAENI